MDQKEKRNLGLVMLLIASYKDERTIQLISTYSTYRKLLVVRLTQNSQFVIIV
jgi:hypothetical protein